MSNTVKASFTEPTPLRRSGKVVTGWIARWMSPSVQPQWGAALP